MIRVHLDRLLFDRRMTLTALAARAGVSLANLSLLKRGRVKAIRFSTLDALCRELECAPGDLLSYETERAGKTARGPAVRPSRDR